MLERKEHDNTSEKELNGTESNLLDRVQSRGHEDAHETWEWEPPRRDATYKTQLSRDEEHNKWNENSTRGNQEKIRGCRTGQQFGRQSNGKQAS